MKKLIVLLLVAVFIQTQAYAISSLHTEGKYIKNETGSVVFLRGVNRPSGFTVSATGNWFENDDWIWGSTYSGGWSETGLRQRLQQIKDMGFNTIRLIFWEDWWQEDVKVYNDNGVEKPLADQTYGYRYMLEETVRIAQEYGIYIVLTPYGECCGQGDMPFPGPTVPNQQAFADMWRNIAQTLDYPNVLFELFNEPSGGYDEWMNAAQAAISSIRSVSDNLIIVQYGYCASFEFVTDSRIQGTNIVYSNHIYRYPPGSTLNGYYGDFYTYDGIKNTLLNNWDYDVALASNKPLYIGEFGRWYASDSKETQAFENLMKLMNEWGMSYTAWEWDHPWMGWYLQSDASAAPFPANTYGQMLSDYITSGGSQSSTCSDGTAYGSCSATKPKYCNSGTLINRCSQCGCPTGQSCNSSSDSCYTPSQQSYGSPAVSDLHVDGKYLKDKSGNVVILQGVNAGGFGDTASGWLTTNWNEQTVRNHFQAMKDWGLNAVRIMGTARWWLENSKENLDGNDVCTLSHRDAIKRTIEIADEYDIYVIFSFWSIDTVGSRSPTIQDYLPYPPRAASQNYNTIRNSNDFVELWAGNSSTSSFLARFKNVNASGSPPTTSQHVHNSGTSPPSVIEALWGYPNVIYELYNEPAGDDSGWASVTQQVVDAIRARGDNHPIMVQAGYCGSFYAWFNAMNNRLAGRTNVIYSNHIYRSDGSLPGNPYTYEDVNYALMEEPNNPPGFGIGHVLNQNLPVVIGEIGSGTSSQELEYFGNSLRVLNENNVGWLGWEWRSGSLYSGSFSPTSRGQILQEYAGSVEPPEPTSKSLSGSLKNSNNQAVQATITVYQGSNVVGTSQTDSNGNYDLSVTPGTYDVQFNISNIYIKIMSVPLSSDISNIISKVNYSSNKLSFTSKLDNIEFRVLGSSPSRVLLNNSEISMNASLSNNSYYYSNGITRIKVTPDLKSNCIYQCCKSESRYNDKPCSSSQYCSNKVCVSKQACAYECCSGEETYVDKNCPTEKTCSNHACVSSSEKIFGYTGQTTSGVFIADVITGGIFTIPENGIPKSITAGVYSYNAGLHAKGAIYDQSGNLIASTEEKTVPYPSEGSMTFNIIGTAPQLNAGSGYYLVVWGQGGSTALRSQWTGSDTVVGMSSSYGSFPSTATFSTVQSQSIALISCNYTKV